MGLDIHFRGDPGLHLAYSVERVADGTFFDFQARAFRPLEDVDETDVTRPLPSRGRGEYGTEFKQVTDGSEYIVRVHDRGAASAIVAEMPVGIGGARKMAELEEAARMPEPSYRQGKKYCQGQEIPARYRYTFFGNDGYTIHTAVLWEDGTSSCNCPRWTKKVPGSPRHCPHAERALTLTVNVDDTGTIPVPPTPSAPGAAGPQSARRRQRTVDTD